MPTTPSRGQRCVYVEHHESPGQECLLRDACDNIICHHSMMSFTVPGLTPCHPKASDVPFAYISSSSDFVNYATLYAMVGQKGIVRGGSGGLESR